MYKIRCEDCGKSYDYDEDAFCPHCGAFNQPRRGEGAMRITRMDGLSEEGHTNSFLHKEYHEEERERRRSGLDKDVVKRITVRRSSGGKKTGGMGVFKKILIGYFLLMILSTIFRSCQYIFW